MNTLEHRLEERAWEAESLGLEDDAARFRDLLRIFRGGIAKHPGPDGGDIHGTGRDQSVHGRRGGGQEGSSVGQSTRDDALAALNEQRLPTSPRPGIDDNPLVVEAAASMYQRALDIEHQVTTSLLDAFGPDAEFFHFEERVKFEGSIRSKIHRTAVEMLEGGLVSTYEEGLEAAVAPGAIKDLNRYTVLIPADRYVDEAIAAVERLQALGYEPHQLKNYWAEGPTPYDGYNTQWRTPDGSFFELQIHTPESAELAERNHVIYTSTRDLPSDHPRVREAREEMGRTIAQRSHIPPRWIMLPGTVYKWLRRMFG